MRMRPPFSYTPLREEDKYPRKLMVQLNCQAVTIKFKKKTAIHFVTFIKNSTGQQNFSFHSFFDKL